MQSPSVVILGTDAVIAARPATPVQLAHACRTLGYDVAVPVSWGDELVAAELLRQLAPRDGRPAIVCACPHVARRLFSTGTDLAPFLLPALPPPVAAARYVRALSAGQVHVTYVGECPAAGDAEIDQRLTPAELLAAFAEHDIGLANQPLVFDSVIPPDRRRFSSQPGGLPTPELLWSGCGAPWLIEIESEDYPAELAEYLLGHDCVLLDLSVRLGCVCSGATASSTPAGARAAVTALEPPRAPRTVVDAALHVDVASPADAIARYAGTNDVPPPAQPDAQADTHTDPVDSDNLGSTVTRDVRDAAMAAGPERHSPALANDGPVEATGEGTDELSDDVLPETVPQGAGAQEDDEQPRRRAASPGGTIRPQLGTVPVARTGQGRSLPRAYAALRRSAPPPAGGRKTPTDVGEDLELPPPEPAPPALPPAPTPSRTLGATARRAVDLRDRSRVLLIAGGALAGILLGSAAWRGMERHAAHQRSPDSLLRADTNGVAPARETVTDSAAGSVVRQPGARTRARP